MTYPDVLRHAHGDGDIPLVHAHLRGDELHSHTHRVVDTTEDTLGIHKTIQDTVTFGPGDTFVLQTFTADYPNLPYPLEPQ